MPVVAIGVERLNRFLGVSRPMAELVEALENLGCDVEDTAEVVHYRCAVCGMTTEKLAHEAPPKRCDQCCHQCDAALSEGSRQDVIRLDLLADRPDLFDTGGICRALKGVLGIEEGLPHYEAHPGTIVVHIDSALEHAESYRPHIVCAEVEMPPLDEEMLRELMRLQESLHWGVGRDRKLCSIGVYDLAAIEPPIKYTTIRPDGGTFVPLAYGTKALTARAILEEHPKGAGYAHLLSGLSAYPLLVDSRGQVLSMPPIINSEETRLKKGSTRLFVDVTGIVEDAPKNALHTLVCSMVEMGGLVKTVEVVQSDGRSSSWPDLKPRRQPIDLRDARRWLGLDSSNGELRRLFRKMRLSVEGEGDKVEVSYPAFRTDIRHPVDLYADLAIGVGYAKMPSAQLPTPTQSSQRPEELLANRVRQILLGMGCWEIMSLIQTTNDHHFDALRIEPKGEFILISNPKNSEVNIVRCHLMTGLLETFQKNRRKSAPQSFFEVGNVVLLEPGAETGTREERRVAFATMGPEAGFATVRSQTDGLLHELGVSGQYRAEEHPSFVSGRCAKMEVPGSAGVEIRGRLGEIHPAVLERFSIPYPVALAEITLCRVL